MLFDFLNEQGRFYRLVRSGHVRPPVHLFFQGQSWIQATMSPRFFHFRFFPRFYLLAGIWFFFQVACAAQTGSTTLLSRLNIRIYGDPLSLAQIQSLLSDFEKKLDRALPHLPPRNNDWLSVFILDPGEDVPALPPMGRAVILTTDASVDTIAFSCARALIARRLDAPEKTLRYFDWLAAATVFDRFYTRDPVGMYRPNYRMIQYALDRGSWPSPGDLADYSISPEFPHVFLLFATWSHAFQTVLDQLPAGKVTALTRFTTLINKGVIPEDAWHRTWQKSAGENRTSTAWLEKNLHLLVRRYSRDLKREANPVDAIGDILEVAVLLPGPDGTMGYKRVPIHELRERFPGSRLDNETLQAMEQKIFSLSRQVPLTLQPALGLFMGAIQERLNGLSRNKFLIRIEEAEANLARAMEQHCGILAMLDTIENHYGDNRASLIPALKVSAEQAARIRTLDPDITRFLDRFSSGFPGPNSP